MKNIKRFLSVLMTLVLTLGLVSPVRAMAEEVEPEPPSLPRAYDDWLWYDFLRQPTQIPGRLVLDERTFFTQDELREMIPPLEVRTRFQGMTEGALVFDLPRGYRHGYYPPSWTSRPHPDRRMTDQELSEWIEEYRLLGGLNVFELEVIYHINEIRAEHGLTPLTICPYQSMAARLGSQLRLRQHADPHYGRPADRLMLFDPTFDRERASVGEVITAGAIPMHSVTSWMDSPGHRAIILRPHHRYIGVGQHSAGQVVAKLRWR